MVEDSSGYEGFLKVPYGDPAQKFYLGLVSIPAKKDFTKEFYILDEGLAGTPIGAICFIDISVISFGNSFCKLPSRHWFCD